jgi:hypothetical protein
MRKMGMPCTGALLGVVRGVVWGPLPRLTVAHASLGFVCDFWRFLPFS